MLSLVAPPRHIHCSAVPVPTVLHSVLPRTFTCTMLVSISSSQPERANRVLNRSNEASCVDSCLQTDGSRDCKSQTRSEAGAVNSRNWRQRVRDAVDPFYFIFLLVFGHDACHACIRGTGEQRKATVLTAQPRVAKTTGAVQHETEMRHDPCCSVCWYTL